jgi:hypothetical protein
VVRLGSALRAQGWPSLDLTGCEQEGELSEREEGVRGRLIPDHEFVEPLDGVLQISLGLLEEVLAAEDDPCRLARYP